MKLIRLILAYVEKAKSTGDIPIPEFADYTKCAIGHHVKLCEEAGFLDIVLSAHDKAPVLITRMTWQGHDVLDRLRDST